MLMNDLEKTFVSAVYNSFLKIKLNCDKVNMHLSAKRVLEDGFEDSCVLKIV